MYGLFLHHFSDSKNDIQHYIPILAYTTYAGTALGWALEIVPRTKDVPFGLVTQKKRYVMWV